MPHLVVLATGGTISSRTDDVGTAVSTDGAASLVHRAHPDAHPAAHTDAEPADLTIETVDVLRKGSYEFTLRDLRLIAESVAAHAARPDVDGIVVTHGTDTLEETAMLLDLVHASDIPVVLTGAQKTADSDAPDGPRNLLDAIAVAASPQSRRRGVLVAFAGNIYAARGTHKVHTVAASPFATQDGDPLGQVRDGEVSFDATSLPEPSTSAHPLAIPDERFDAVRVDLINSYPGADGQQLVAAARAGATGAVIIGTGVGNANSSINRAAADAIANGMLVAVSTRVFSGPVVAVYGGGGAVDLINAGGIIAGGLPVSQVRILMALVLSLYEPELAAAEFYLRLSAQQN